MGLPAHLDRLHIASASAEELPFQLPTRIQQSLYRHQIYRLRIDSISYFVVADEVLMAEDDGEYFDDSALLPDLRVVGPSSHAAI